MQPPQRPPPARPSRGDRQLSSSTPPKLKLGAQRGEAAMASPPKNPPPALPGFARAHSADSLPSPSQRSPAPETPPRRMAPVLQSSVGAHSFDSPQRSPSSPFSSAEEATQTLPEFGVKLQRQRKRYNALRGIPFPLLCCVDYFTKDLATDNSQKSLVAEKDKTTRLLSLWQAWQLYDASDSSLLSTIDLIKKELERGATQLAEGTDPGAAAAIVRDFIRLLPEPLIPTELLDRWKTLPEDASRKEIAKAIITECLPKDNYNTLHYILTWIKFLTKLLQQKQPQLNEKDSLSSKQLIASVASTLLSSTSETAQEEAAKRKVDMTAMLEDFLSGYKWLFPPPYLLPIKDKPKDKTKEGEENTATSVFGAPLEQVMARQQRTHPQLKVPFLVRSILDWLYSNTEAFTQTGLFRLSGNATIIKQIQQRLDQGLEVDWTNGPTIHDAASVLKAYFRSLPEPLFTFALSEEWKEVAQTFDETVAVPKLKALWEKLPEHNRNLWLELNKFLFVLHRKAELNKMTADNIGIVWGPNVLWTRDLMPMMEMGSIVSLFIEHFAEIFPEEAAEETQRAIKTEEEQNAKQSHESANKVEGSGEKEDEETAALSLDYYLSILILNSEDKEKLMKFPQLRKKELKKALKQSRLSQKKQQKIKEKEEKERMKEIIKKKKEEQRLKAAGMYEEERAENEVRIVMVGSLSCGKSCLVTRLRFQEYEEVDDPTLQDFHKHNMDVDGEPYFLNIMDISGDLSQYQEVYPQWLRWGDGFMLVYNIGDAGTLDSLSVYKDLILKAKGAKAVPMCLVGTQADLDEEGEREVLTSDGKSLAFTWKCPFIEASSQTGINVDEAFENLVIEIRDFGKDKEAQRLTRVERERAWQEREKKRLEESASPNSSKSPSRKGSTSAATSEAGPDMIVACPNYVIEEGQTRNINRKYHTEKEELEVEHKEHNLSWYTDYFYGKEHKNYCGMDPTIGPVVVSVVKEQGSTWRILARTIESIDRKIVGKKEMGSKANTKKIFKIVNEQISVSHMKQVKDPKLTEELLKFEQQSMVNTYKFGVICMKEGQTTEDEWLSNTSGIDSDLNKFLECIAQKIELKGWTRFRGGLDVNANSTGKHSFFAEWKGMQVMFHVSTLLPRSRTNSQQLDRKRHIGNDICVLVFQEGENALFDPTAISSEFNHVFVVVRKEKSNTGDAQEKPCFRVKVAYQEGVPPFKPNLPNPPVFVADDHFKEVILAKLINAENACYKAPAFVTKMKRVRAALFQNMVETFVGGSK